MKPAIALSALPNWKALRAEVPEVAARQVGNILAALDRAEKHIYAVRGMAALLIEERQLFRFIVDEEVGDYYQSFDKWLKDTCPESWGDVRKALRAVKELQDVPFEDLLQMKRCNVEQLKQASSSVRVLPEVIEAAKRLPEKKLVETLNAEYEQHLECHVPVLMAPVGDVAEFEQAVECAMFLEECGTRQEALKAIAVDYLESHREEWEQRKQADAA